MCQRSPEFLSSRIPPRRWSHEGIHSADSSPRLQMQACLCWWIGESLQQAFCHVSCLLTITSFSIAICDRPMQPQIGNKKSGHYQPAENWRAGNVDKNPTPVCLPPHDLIALERYGIGGPCSKEKGDFVPNNSLLKRIIPWVVKCVSEIATTPGPKDANSALPATPVGLQVGIRHSWGPGFIASPILI